MITVYGRVTEMEASAPPGPYEPPVVPPEEVGTEAWALAQGLRTKGVEPREGEPVVENWMHVHIVLDPPHSGEIEINAPGFAVSAMLTVGGRARVMLSAS
jgi:hypothetical protein